ncbi:MAG: hypothetical protein KDB21_05400 [Acidimicrobiales bacterium]|nr:hypothetical protein [Acidimicrobiales bacterium]
MTDYSAAVQNAADAFRVEALRTATFATMPMLGVPAAASGQNAVVFRCDAGGAPTAVRCFTSEPSNGADRYRALQEHRRSADVAALAQAYWIDDAVLVNGRAWPVVMMEWVQGEPLHDWVEARRHDASSVRAMADRWRSLMALLRRCSIAHGDLQHGNVLVGPGDTLRLIDFDGVWVPGISASPPQEWGHPNYQHPTRLAGRVWGEHIDWYSALVIHTSLLAVAADPALWEFHNGENLVLTDADLRGPGEIWDRLSASPDPLVRRASELLQQARRVGAATTTDLEALLEAGLPADAPGPELADAPSSPHTAPWWESPSQPHPQPQRPSPSSVPPSAPLTPPPPGPTPQWEPVVAGGVFTEHMGTPPASPVVASPPAERQTTRRGVWVAVWVVWLLLGIGLVNNHQRSNIDRYQIIGAAIIAMGSVFVAVAVGHRGDS